MRHKTSLLGKLLLIIGLAFLTSLNSYGLTNGLSIGISFASEEPNGAGSSLAAGDVAGALPQANWNNVTGANGTANSLNLDRAGVSAATGVSVTWSCPNTWSSTGRGEENNGFAAGPNRQLMVGYLDSNDQEAGGVNITVTGLGPEFTAGGYDVIVYATGGTSANRYGRYTVNGVTKYINVPANASSFSEDKGVDVSAGDSGNYAVFSGNFSSSITINTASPTPFGNGVRAPVNAIQIVSRSPLPNVVNIGGNKLGTVAHNGEGSFTIVGGGSDIWDGRDEFTYAYKEVEGDFDVQVRVADLQANGDWTKAGLMVRETLSEFSRKAFLRVTPNNTAGNGVKLAYRTGLDNSAGPSGGQHEDGGGETIPVNSIPNVWLRIVRAGSFIHASNSLDGVTWGLVASQDTAAWGGGALSNKLNVGLAVTRNGNGLTAAAEFRDYKQNQSAAFAVAGASSRGNPRGVRAQFNNNVGAGATTAANYTLTAVSGPTVSIVKGLRFTTANDAIERDPMTFRLEGSHSASGPWTLIATGNTGLGTARFETAPDVAIVNDVPYASYRLTFPTVRNEASANSMQIAEVVLLDEGGNDITSPGDPVIPTSGNSPGGEQAPNAIDNNSATKYLNFDKLNTGFVVTPSLGIPTPNPTVLAAAVGPTADAVQLTTSPLVETATYMLNVQNVQDAAAGALTAADATFVHGAGYEARRIRVTHNKTDDGGYYRSSDAVAKGIGDVIHVAGGVYPGELANTLFEDTVPDNDQHERYSARISGVLDIQTSGNYKFYMSSDDVGFLYLSTDASAANKAQIANEPAWNGNREYIAGGNQSSRGTPPANISANIPLQKGGQYYLELVFTEGGGGNNGSATWLPPGGAAVANGTLPISETAFKPSRLFDGNVFFSLGNVQITSQPASQTVTALTPATFRVSVDGTPSYRFQWYRNGAAIAGANSSTYTIPVTQPSDDASSYYVTIANEFSSVSSASATLTVLSPTPPHLIGAAADNTFSRVTLTFDNRLSVATAQEVANYSIPGLTINSATRSTDGRSVILNTSAITEGQGYTVTVSGIQDETGTQTIDPNPSSRNFTGWILSQGFALMEVYPTGGGNAVANLTTHASYPNSPSERYYITGIDSRLAYPNNAHEGYGGRISGLFVPTTNGNYSFSLSSDDASEFWGSSDASPANKAKIIEETGCCRAFSAIVSAPIALAQGNRYYYELLWKEGTGGDYGRVSIDQTVPVPGDFLAVYANPDLVQLAITTDLPAHVTNTVNGFRTFTVAASLTVLDGVSRQLRYQWYSNDVAIAGANAASYTTPQLDLGFDGSIYRCAVSAPGGLTNSANSVLHVVVDDVAPVLLSVSGDDTLHNIVLQWSEVMNPGPAVVEYSSNYLLKDAGGNEMLGAITGVITNANGSTIILTLSAALQPGATYTLECDYQSDLVGNSPVPVGAPEVDTEHGVVKSFQAWQFSTGFALFQAYTGLTVQNNNDVTPVITAINSRPANFQFYSNVVNWPQTVPDLNKYGMRWTFYFTAPTAGDYKFEPAHDDGVRIYAALDGNPNAKTAVFDAGCCTGFGAGEAGWTVNLTAGQRIFIEVVVVEDGGGDYAGLAVTLPNGQYIAPLGGDLISTVYNPVGASVNITQQPVDLTYNTLGGTPGTPLLQQDFNAADGGFTVVNAGNPVGTPWAYNATTGLWSENDQRAGGGPGTTALNTTALTISAPGKAILTFQHRYSFEADAWDGGQVMVSVNGGPFATVPSSNFTANGYSGLVRSDTSIAIKGQEAFVLTSQDYGTTNYLTTTCQLGIFAPGDQIVVQFIAHHDDCCGASSPAWEITGVDIQEGVGGAARFSVTATAQNDSGSNPTRFYQWYRNDGAGWNAIAGANLSSYTFTPVSADNGAQFRVFVGILGASATSSTATLTVIPPPINSVRGNDGSMTISWKGAFVIQETTEIRATGTPWVPSTVVNGVPFNPTGVQKYYRLVPAP